MPIEYSGAAAGGLPVRPADIAAIEDSRSEARVNQLVETSSGTTMTRADILAIQSIIGQSIKEHNSTPLAWEFVEGGRLRADFFSFLWLKFDWEVGRGLLAPHKIPTVEY